MRPVSPFCVVGFADVRCDGGLDKYVRGVYAITVKGRIPEDVEQELESQGIKYRPRDQTEVD